MHWTNVCVEGYCFCETDDDDNAPCGANVPSPFCLSNNICPLFAYSETTERDVARFPKFRYILKDRLGIWAEDFWGKLCWWFRDCLWFNRRKVDKFFDNIGIATAEDTPFIAEMEREERNAQDKFVEWFKKAGKERDAKD